MNLKVGDLVAMKEDVGPWVAFAKNVGNLRLDELVPRQEVYIKAGTVFRYIGNRSGYDQLEFISGEGHEVSAFEDYVLHLGSIAFYFYPFDPDSALQGNKKPEPITTP